MFFVQSFPFHICPFCTFLSEFVLPPSLLFIINIDSSFVFACSLCFCVVSFQYLSANFVIFQNVVFLDVLALDSCYFMTLSQSLDFLFIWFILKKTKFQNA